MYQRAPGEGKEYEIPFLLPYAPECTLFSGVRIKQRYFQLFTRRGPRGCIRLERIGGRPFLIVGDWKWEIPEWVYEKILTNRQFFRIRSFLDEFRLTAKRKQLSDEWEIVVPDWVGELLWPLGEDRECAKTRYLNPWPKGGTIEIDALDWGLWRGEYEADQALVKIFQPREFSPLAVDVRDHELFGSTRSMVEYVNRYGVAKLRKRVELLIAA